MLLNFRNEATAFDMPTTQEKFTVISFEPHHFPGHDNIFQHFGLKTAYSSSNALHFY